MCTRKLEKIATYSIILRRIMTEKYILKKLPILSEISQFARKKTQKVGKKKNCDSWKNGGSWKK